MTKKKMINLLKTAGELDDLVYALQDDNKHSYILEKCNYDYDEIIYEIQHIVGYDEKPVKESKPKKSTNTRKKTFCKTEIKKYFGMDVDDCGGLFKGYVYLEIHGRKMILYRMKKNYENMPDYEGAWEVVCETTDKNEIMKHLMVYSDYETYSWWIPYTGGQSWNSLNDVVADYSL